jgi:hypothetical protein
LRPYQEYLSKLIEEFEEIEFTHLEREGNHFADVLVTLPFMGKIDFRYKVQPLHIDIKNFSAQCCSVGWEIDGNLSYYNTKNLMQNQKYPVGAFKTNRKTLRRLQWIST